MKKLIFAAMLCAPVVCGAALAQEDARSSESDQAVQANQQPTDDRSAEEIAEGQEVICRRERVTGSLTRVSRTCMTRDEWNGLADRTRDEHGNMVRGASGSSQLCNDPTKPTC